MLPERCCSIRRAGPGTWQPGGFRTDQMVTLMNLRLNLRLTLRWLLLQLTGALLLAGCAAGTHHDALNASAADPSEASPEVRQITAQLVKAQRIAREQRASQDISPLVSAAAPPYTID